MNTGRPLVQIAQEIQDMEKGKHDYVAPASKLHMVGVPGAVNQFRFGDVHMKATPFAVAQIATQYGIPQKYLETLQTERPELVAKNINGWLEKDNRKRMVRTLTMGESSTPTLRAFLSDRYRQLDNFDLMTATLPTIQELNLQIRSTELTERHLFIKATLPTMQSKITDKSKVGDIVEAGIEVRNSEVGSGAVTLNWLVFRLSCLNGMRVAMGNRQYHVGKKQGSLEEGLNIQPLLRDETRAAQDKAFWMQYNDVLRGAFNREAFEQVCNKFRDASEQKIDGNLSQVVEVTRKRFGLSEELGASILENLSRDGDLTRWGLANAVTFAANELKDYEDSTKLEGIGGEIIELPRTDWESIAKAA